MTFRCGSPGLQHPGSSVRGNEQVVYRTLTQQRGNIKYYLACYLNFLGAQNCVFYQHNIASTWKSGGPDTWFDGTVPGADGGAYSLNAWFSCSDKLSNAIGYNAFIIGPSAFDPSGATGGGTSAYVYQGSNGWFGANVNSGYIPPSSIGIFVN